MRKGFAVQIKRKDGSTFLASSASSGGGILPFVHVYRKWAVAKKRELIAEGFRCRVVKVVFIDPVIMP